jgi:hypothetical protein
VPELSDEEGIGYLEKLDKQLVDWFTDGIYKL